MRKKMTEKCLSRRMYGPAVHKWGAQVLRYPIDNLWPPPNIIWSCAGKLGIPSRCICPSIYIIYEQVRPVRSLVHPFHLFRAVPVY